MPIINHLCADDYGMKVAKTSERLDLSKDEKTLVQAPLMHLESVTVASMGVTLTTDAIAACCEHGIPIVFMDRRGDVFATLHSPKLVGTVQTRREQLLAYTDDRGSALAAEFCATKAANQAATLRYWARLRWGSNPDLAVELENFAADIESIPQQIRQASAIGTVDVIRGTLMGLEGQCAHRYWQAVGRIIPREYAWPSRETRGASDPINSLLNYGYAMLYAEAERAIMQAGLDPYAGFLHADRPGKTSLVFDLVEEFRQAVIDRVVVGLAARHYTVKQNDHGLLETETRRDFASKVGQQLDAKMRYGADRHPLRHVILSQAKAIASFVRRDSPTYDGFAAEA
ncbi:MAG: CRISPR-associated endonuclease Cas1 [Chloroflexi bacterium]|jgi:CRISPR-associated protein Cas1|nr:MAG: CRISPR-associated endonuclease Cas1 [Chloroflexota bacterium]